MFFVSYGVDRSPARVPVVDLFHGLDEAIYPKAADARSGVFRYIDFFVGVLGITYEKELVISMY